MSLNLPSNPARANSDAATDSPKLALLTDLYAHIGTTIDFLAAMGNLATKQYGNGFAIETLGSGTADKLHIAIGTSAKTAAYTVIASDRGKLIDATTGTWTLSLTAAATLGDNWFCYLRNSGTGIITIDPNAAEGIDGEATVTLTAGQSCILQCTGTAFKTIGRAGGGSGLQGETTYNTNTTLNVSTDNGFLIRCTSAGSPNTTYTFPDAAGNEGKHWWLQNATSGDTALRLVADGADTLGGATGSTIYIPAYTTIGFVSDGTNWLVFSYSGKTIWTFTASGTWYCPPGKNRGVGTVVGGGSSGASVTGPTVGNAGSTTSIGALLTANGGPGAQIPGSTPAASPNGTTPDEGMGDGTTANDNRGGSGLYGQGGRWSVVDNTLIPPTGYGSGGGSGRLVDAFASGYGGARRIKESISPLPGVAYAITVGSGGSSSGSRSGAGTAGIAIVELN